MGIDFWASGVPVKATPPAFSGIYYARYTGENTVNIWKIIKKELVRKVEREIEIAEEHRFLNEEDPYREDRTEYEQFLNNLALFLMPKNKPSEQWSWEPDDYYTESRQKDLKRLEEEKDKWESGEKQSPLSGMKTIID